MTVSENVTQAYSSLREFNLEVSSLLLSADAMMEEIGWNRFNNTCQADGSSSINGPERWLPREFFLFFKTDSTPHLIVGISVLVDDWGEGHDLNQALVSGCCLDYGAVSKVGNNWSYWFAHWHLLMKDRSDDGTICRNSYENSPDYIKQSWSLARPLSDVTDGSSLNELIIAPLLDTAGISRSEES